MARTDYPNAMGGGVAVTITRPPRGPVTLGWICVIHGLGGSAEGSTQGKSWLTYPQALGDLGFGLIGCDMPNWPSPTSRTRLANLWTYYQTLPDAWPWWHILAVSDGGGQTLDWLPQGTNASKVRRVRLHNPLTDTRWAYGLAGYTPAYTTGGVVKQAGWPADMDSQFSGNWPTNSPGYRINDNPALLRGLPVRIEVAQAPDDGSLPPNAASWLVGQINDPNITLRAGGGLTGGHTNHAAYPVAELEAFYRGWYAPLVAGPSFVAAGTVASLASAGTSKAVSLPAGVAAGQLLVAVLGFDTNPGTVTPPAGWTLVRTTVNASASQTLHVARRVADGSEGATATWSWGNSRTMNGGIASYAGVDATTPFDVESVQDVTTAAATLTHNGVTTTTPNCRLVGGAVLNSGAKTVNPPSGWTEAWEGTGGKSTEHAYSPVQASAGASGGLSWATSDASTTKALLWVAGLRAA